MDFIQYAIGGSLTVVIETIIYWIFFNGVFERKKRGWKNGLVLLLYPITLTVVSYYVGLSELMASVKIIILLFIDCIITKRLFHASWKNIIVYQGIFALFSVIGDSIAMGIMSISHGTVNMKVLLGNNAIVIQGTILSKIINIIIVSLFVKKMGKQTNRYSLSEMCIMLLQGISGIACLMMVVEYSYYCISTYKVASLYLIIVSILIITAYIVFYNVFDSYIKKRNIEQEAMKIQFYNKGQYEYYAALEEENVNVRKMYHDIKNHLLAIQGLSNEHTNASQLYLQNCLEAVNGYNEFFDTGNKLADILLYEKCSTAKINNIDTRVMIQNDSLNGIEMLDLCAILTNSFDNAIEACKQCSGERMIQVKAIKNEASVVITFKNNYEVEPIKSKDGRLITHKKNKGEHGVGMLSVKMTAQKYNGNVEVSIDQDKKEFLLVIMIPIAYQNTL